MSKRNWTKVLGLLLSIMMIASLVGCGEQNKETTAAPQPTDKATEAPGTDAPTDAPTEEAGITYPLETNVELRFWSTSALKYNKKFNSAEESPFHAGLSKNTGVKINWEFPQSGVSNAQAFNLLLTEKVEDMPHIIYYSGAPGQADSYIKDGLIWDLTDYLPEYAPDYWEYINSNEDYVRDVTTTSGKFYMFAASVEGDLNITYKGLVVRKDWLDACGLDIPVTLDDWTEMLTKFKEKYGATFSSPKAGIGMASGTGAYADTEATFYVNDEGKVVFANTQPEYKEFLQKMNQWFNDGLMDPDFFTNDATAIRNKCANNEVGAMYIGSGTFRNVLADAEGTAAEWIAVPHPVAKEGDKVTWIQTRQSELVGNGAMITKACSEEELIVALKLLNYAYTEEGHMYWNFGTLGETYTLDANGNPAWTDLITKDEAGEGTAYKYYTGVGSNGPVVQSQKLIALLNQGEAGNALVQWTANSVAREHCMPAVVLSDGEHLAYWDRMTPIYSEVSESVTKFILGQKSFDEWDDFVDTLNQMGLPDAQKIQQQAYDAWLEK